MRKEFIIANIQGIHARPATLLVNLVNKFECDITLEYEGITVDFKSIMGVLSLGVKRGSLIVVRTKGVDEVEAMKAISNQIKEFRIR